MSKQSVQIGEGHCFPLSYRVASAAVEPACKSENIANLFFARQVIC